MGQDVIPIINDVDITLDRCIHNSFKINYQYENIYIDFDDTLIINGKVNSTAMKFLYQSFNFKKNIYLLTKHETDIYKDLDKYCINKDLFKEIYRLDKSEHKTDYVIAVNSIFIDNYFKERLEVHRLKKIPVFDVDAIECLIDDSEV